MPKQSATSSALVLTLDPAATCRCTIWWLAASINDRDASVHATAHALAKAAWNGATRENNGAEQWRNLSELRYCPAPSDTST